jgi:adenylate cyclase
MAEERVRRRLAVILAADVVGYSRLMEIDEAGTLAALKTRRKAILEPLVDRHGGRVFKFIGDGVLVEFASAMNAVQCAIELQREMAVANSDLSEARRIVLRIGINLGDVLAEGGDLYGDGINVAARLQGLAEPGEVWLAGSVYDQVEKKLDLAYDDLGLRNMKNMRRPVRVYRVGFTAGTVLSGDSRSETSTPSIAVLPFDNISGDSDQQYFSDGITEDIITELSRFRQLFVLARHSSFQFRGSAADVKQVGRQLNARYVVEGSVRRYAERIRITAQLIDVADGAHLWAERYDRSSGDIFEIQDDVAQQIVRTIVGRLEFAAKERAKRRPTNSLAAYDCLLRARDHMWRVYYDTQAYLREGMADAQRMCERAIQLDPGYARAHACLGHAYMFDWLYRGRAEDLDRATNCGRTAIGLDDGDDFCHAALGGFYQKRGEHDLAEFHLRKAVALNPNDVDTISYMGVYLVYVGQPLQAIEWLEKAMRRNPFCTDLYHETLGMAHYLVRRFEESVASFRRIRTLSSWGHAYLAACHAQLGRPDAARAEIAAYLRDADLLADKRPPGETVRPESLIAPLIADLRTHKNPADFELWLDGLRKAGLSV